MNAEANARTKPGLRQTCNHMRTLQIHLRRWGAEVFKALKRSIRWSLLLTRSGNRSWVLTCAAIIVLMVTTLFPVASSARDRVLLASEGDFPPFNFIDRNGDLRGLERDLGDEICRRASLNCIWVITNWDGIIEGLEAGSYDAILAGMAATAERDMRIDFSNSYMPGGSTAVFAARHSFVDLRSARIAVQTGTVQHEWLMDAGFTVVPFNRTENAVAALWDGSADAVFADTTYIRAAQASLSGRLTFLKTVLIPTPGTSIAVRQGDFQLRQTFNEALAEMRSDGTLQQLIKKWFTPGTAEF